MNTIYRDAILKASRVRRELGLTMYEPISIFDACTKMGVCVRFVDISMEGFYLKQKDIPTILISNLRPFPRRCFTCAHELGHHIFGHGTRLDILIEKEEHSTLKDEEEVLVDAFAGALLIPVAGVQAEFIKRRWDIKKASPLQFYTICSVFGIGYSTLVTHCRVNDLISNQHASTLIKVTPAKLFKNHFGEVNDKSYFRIIDQHSNLKAVDLEVSNYLIVPTDTIIEGKAFEVTINTTTESVYVAKESGIYTAYFDNRSYFIRVQKMNYSGLADYRHLEN